MATPQQRPNPGYPVTDGELRLHYEFVHIYESLRKQGGHRDMGDDALRQIAQETGLLFETLRIARHLRNGIAHDDPVNSDTVRKYLDKLVAGALPPDTSGALDHGPEALRSRPTPPNAYRIHAWKDARLEEESIANGFIAVSGDEVGDISAIDDPYVLKDLLSAALPDRTPRAINLFTGYCMRFKRAEVGDVIVMPTRDRTVAVGELVGPHIYAPTADPRARHRRAVSWLAEGIDRDAVSSDLRKEIETKHTVQTINSPHGAQRLLALAATGIDPGPDAFGDLED